MMEQHIRRPRCGWSAPRPNHAIGGQRRFQLRRLKPAVEKIRGALGHHPQGLDQVGGDQPHRRQPEAAERHHVPPLPPQEVRWGPEQPRFNESGDALQKRLVIWIPPGIAGGEARNLCGGRLIVAPDKQMPAVREWAEECRVFRQDLVAEAFQFQIPDDLGLQQPTQICGSGDAEPRPDLFGHARTTDDGPAFQDEDRQARPRQIRRGDQAVVAGTHDDHVVGRRHRGPSPKRPLPSRDAMRCSRTL